MVKQITVEELFGSSLPKDPSLPTMPTQSNTVSSDPSAAYVHKQPYPAPPPQSTLLIHQHAAQDPGSNQRNQAPGLLPAPYALHPSPVFQSVIQRSDPQLHSSVSPLIVPSAAPPGTAGPPTAQTSYMGQDILATLKPAAPSVNSDHHKPILAPNFLPSTLVPPHSFREPMGKPLLQHGKDVDVFSQSPNLIKQISVSSAFFFFFLVNLNPVFLILFHFLLFFPLSGCPHESKSCCSRIRGFCAAFPQCLPAVPQ